MSNRPTNKDLSAGVTVTDHGAALLQKAGAKKNGAIALSVAAAGAAFMTAWSVLAIPVAMVGAYKLMSDSEKQVINAGGTSSVGYVSDRENKVSATKRSKWLRNGLIGASAVSGGLGLTILPAALSALVAHRIFKEHSQRKEMCGLDKVSFSAEQKKLGL